MSFFDDASLVFLPSGQAGKDGKAYSMKPTNGDGDFTFSRGSNLTATRVDSNGLIEKGRENLLLQSNQFDTTWTTSEASVTSGQSGYDGSSDAWELEADSDGNGRRINQSITQSGVSVFSVYVKAGTTDFIRLNVTGAGNCYFNISESNPSVLTSSDVKLIGSIQPIGNGWYRCSLLNVTGSSITEVRINLASGDNDLSAVTGDNIYIQDAQLEQGLVATEYIESGASTGLAGILEDSPRFDYSGGASCPSLLLEPSRTNEIGYSEYFEGSNWSLANSATRQLRTSITAPDGNNAVYLLSGNGTDNNGRIQENLGASSNDYIYSVFVKGIGTATRIRLRNHIAIYWLEYNIDSSGNFSLHSVNAKDNYYGIEDYGNGWHRIYIKIGTNGADQYYQIFPDILDGNGSIYVWGAQAEEASYPTSYIPNHSGGSVTREADVCEGAGTSSTFNADEGVFYAEISTNTDDTDKTISLNNAVSGSLNNRLWMGYSTSDKRIYALGYVNNSLQFALSKLMTDESLFVKIACRYKRNDIAFFVNGEKVGTDTTALNFTELSSLDFNIGTAVSGAAPLYGNVKQVLVFNSYLSDSEIITLTS